MTKLVVAHIQCKSKNYMLVWRYTNIKRCHPEWGHVR